MAEERTLGIARARDTEDDEPSKAELQRRMEEARDSITNTVTEIKENVAQQVETVKDALDWREHFKKRPVAWSLGAAGVGFFVGYGLAAALTDDDDYSEDRYVSSPARSYAAQPVVGEPLAAAISPKTNGKHEGPGMLERFKETSAYEKLSTEAGALGDRLIEELSTAAQVVVLPALLKKVKNWIGLDLSGKTASMGGEHSERSVSSRQPDRSISSPS
ncbi:MAG: hypothetical protein M3539_07880 [Acidobacteriota bacterium]|nr:hypothetical protein [Acidobacteriota bacterium]